MSYHRAQILPRQTYYTLFATRASSNRSCWGEAGTICPVSLGEDFCARLLEFRICSSEPRRIVTRSVAEGHDGPRKRELIPLGQGASTCVGLLSSFLLISGIQSILTKELYKSMYGYRRLSKGDWTHQYHLRRYLRRRKYGTNVCWFP